LSVANVVRGLFTPFSNTLFQCFSHLPQRFNHHLVFHWQHRARVEEQFVFLHPPDNRHLPEAQLPADAAGPILSCKAGVAVVTSDGGVSAFRMEEGTAVAGEYGLSQNYPNPFNPATTFNYQVPREGLVLLTVYNIRGQEMIRLVDGMKSAGAHSVVWDGHDANKRVVPSGVYIAIMKSGNFRKVVKMTMLK